MKKIILLLAVIFPFFSCSLKYDEEKSTAPEAPEFIFKNPVYSQYDNKQLAMRVSAEELEKYKKNSLVYAQKVLFERYDANSEIDTKGECGLLSADDNNGVYMLFDNINLFSKSFDADFHANFLKWNSKTEQLVGSARDTVRVEKKDGIIFGTGFSASGLSGNYKFNGTVTGELESE